MIINILAGVSFAFFFVEIMRWHQKSEWFKRKPFNCVPCLSAWTAVLLYLLPTNLSEFMLIMFGSGTFGALFTQLMYKIYKL
jgi:hypothetical protein